MWPVIAYFEFWYKKPKMLTPNYDCFWTFFFSLLAINFSSVIVCHETTYHPQVTSGDGGISLHRGICSACEGQCCAIRPGWTNRMPCSMIASVLSSLWISMDKLRLSDVSMKTWYQKAPSTLLCIGPTPKRSQEIFIVWVWQLYGWQTLCCLVSRRRWYLFEGI